LIKDIIDSLCIPGILHPSGIKKVIETHISYVLLDGYHAYKIKKPVDLGFVNFTSLEKRKFYCGEEIRLNKRLAADLYIGVITITGPAKKPEINGKGRILEYAVKMKQFPRESELSRLIDSSTDLTEPFHQFCIKLAAFHTVVEVADQKSGFSNGESISSRNIQNFKSIDMDLLTPEETEALTHLKQWTLTSLQNNNDIFNKRIEGGRIRECHGDLHLGNLVYIDTEIIAFDCLEFNEQLRWIDVASELAFLVMDLFARNKPDLARRCLDWYLEESGDYDLVPLFQHYLVYRAMVRAKVCFLTRRPGESLENRKQFQHYLELANRFSSPKNKPKLIITHGFSGSGKTWITDQIIAQSDCIRLRSDIIRKQLHGIGIRDSSQSKTKNNIYSKNADARTYIYLEKTARKILSAGYPVIVDATFLSKQNRHTFKSLAESMNVDFNILDLQADPEVLNKRIRKRQKLGKDASEAGIAVLKKQLASADPLDQFERQNSIVLNSGKDPIDISFITKQLALEF
jgi:aminoglycoside phosphotransferase family enzyme/predicted kinase